MFEVVEKALTLPKAEVRSHTVSYYYRLDLCELDAGPAVSDLMRGRSVWPGRPAN